MAIGGARGKSDQVNRRLTKRLTALGKVENNYHAKSIQLVKRRGATVKVSGIEYHTPIFLSNASSIILIVAFIAFL